MPGTRDKTGKLRAAPSASSDARVIVPVAYRNPHSPGMPVEVLRLSELRAKAPPEFLRRAQRADFLVLVLADSDLVHEVDFQSIRGPRGHLLVVGAGQVQRFTHATAGDGWLLFVSGDLLERGAPHEWAGPIALGRHRSRVRWLFGELRRTSFDPSTPQTRRLAYHLVQLLVCSLGEAPAELATETSVATVFHILKREVERRYASTRVVEDYAKSTGYSSKTLARACHALTGQSAKAFIDARVLLEARRLLAHTSLTVGQIAVRLGFSEATNFSKFFRHHARETALEFRARQSQR
jgi:AraC-like DNA-binding protein